MNLTEDAKQEFLKLVVMKGTTECWPWAGPHDEDFRPVFRGEKAYRWMYEIRIRRVPDGFHVHHKCGNSACVNPRHLVALSPEAHRRVHSTKDKALKERIYQGEWEQIQRAEANERAAAAAEEARRLALRVERERLRREQLERDEKERKERLEQAEQWVKEHHWIILWIRFKWFLLGAVLLLLGYLFYKWAWPQTPPRGNSGSLALWMSFGLLFGLGWGAYECFKRAFERKVPVSVTQVENYRKRQEERQRRIEERRRWRKENPWLMLWYWAIAIAMFVIVLLPMIAFLRSLHPDPPDPEHGQVPASPQDWRARPNISPPPPFPPGYIDRPHEDSLREHKKEVEQLDELADKLKKRKGEPVIPEGLLQRPTTAKKHTNPANR